jgi:hypothetical protein
MSRFSLTSAADLASHPRPREGPIAALADPRLPEFTWHERAELTPVHNALLAACALNNSRVRARLAVFVLFCIIYPKNAHRRSCDSGRSRAKNSANCSADGRPARGRHGLSSSGSAIGPMSTALGRDASSGSQSDLLGQQPLTSVIRHPKRTMAWAYPGSQVGLITRARSGRTVTQRLRY